MISVSTLQQSIIDSDYKEVSWLFRVVDTSDNSYYWSTKAKAALTTALVTTDASSMVFQQYCHPASEEQGHDYTFKIIPDSFDGVEMRRGASESGIQAPTGLSFAVANAGNGLTGSDFEGGEVYLALVIGDGTNEVVIRRWRFAIRTVIDTYQRLDFTCEDFVQEKLIGDYPATQLVTPLFPSQNVPREGTAKREDSYSVPEIYGTAYIPLRPVFVSGDAKRYYLLGPTDVTYTITEAKTPREYGNSSTWASTDFTFQQYTKSDGTTNWRVFEALIAGGNNGVWQEGDYMSDLPTEYSHTGTASMTSPADVIREVLKNMGVAAADIDPITFATAKATYAGWGLTFNGGFYFKEPRERVLSNLLAICNSYLIIDEDIELHVYSTTIQDTITDADISDFKYQHIGRDNNDSGYTAYQESGVPQDEFVRALVKCKSTQANISSDVLLNAFVADSQDVQRAAILHYQRKFLPRARVSFTGKASLIRLNPDDMITINHTNYGGNYKVLIDSLHIGRDLQLDFNCVVFADDLDDWTITPDAITVATDSTTGVYQRPTSGPTTTVSSGNLPNQVTGGLLFPNGADLILSAATGGSADTSKIIFSPFNGITGLPTAQEVITISGSISTVADSSSLTIQSGADLENNFYLGTASKRWKYAEIRTGGEMLLRSLNAAGDYGRLYILNESLYLQAYDFGTTTTVGLQMDPTNGLTSLTGHLTIGASKWVGLGASAGRIEFLDEATDKLNFLGSYSGFGISTPDSHVHIHLGSAGSVSAAANTVLTIENSTTNYLSFLTPNNVSSGILFGDVDDNDEASILYNHNTDDLEITIGGAKTLKISGMGTAGATEQDWIEVDVAGGGTGYIRVYATK